MELKKLNVHIIGGTGQMGSWLKKFLESQGFVLTVSDETTKSDELIRQADIIFVSVPISVAPKVITEIPKKIKSECLLVDLSSVKTDAAKALEKTGHPSLALHFLFGPSISTIQNQKIAFSKVKENKISKELVNMFKKAGAQMIEMSVKEHDYQMAHIQALTHFVNLTLAKILTENKIKLDTRISTPIFLNQISTANRVVAQNPNMISQIQMSNPNFLNVVKKLQEDQERIINLIQKKDEKQLESLYKNIGKYFESKESKRPERISDKKLNTLLLKDKVKIAYLGPEGTFSHQVALQVVTEKALLVSSKTIYDIFNIVSDEICEFGLVPAENSIEGTIRETLDFLGEFDLKVNAEISLEVHQNLLSKEKSLDKIATVISHPQAIAQSRSWLEKNLPGATIEYSPSTISAINQIEKKGIAMIGSILGAKIYGLNIIAKNIESKSSNITKFYLISKNLFSLKKNPTKTLLLLTVFNRVGILKDILTVLADFDINLSKLESRPSREKNWDYYFYVEVESGMNEPRLAQALNILKQFCPVTKILGEY